MTEPAAVDPVAPSTSTPPETTAIECTDKTTSRPKNRRVSVYASQRYQVRLFSPPRQRQKWGDSQILPRVNWGDLFFDLFYVAAFYNLGNILVETPTDTGLLYFLGCFFPILHLWNEKLYYDSRFVYGDDIYHRIFEVVVLAVLATAISYISPVENMSNPSSYIDMFGFSISITICVALNMVRSIECYFWGRGQRKVIEASCRRDLLWKFLLLVFYIVAAILSGMDYFGNKDEAYEYDAATADDSTYKNETDDESHRFMATAEESTKADTDPCSNSDTTNVPILIVLIGYLVNQIYFAVTVVFFFPQNGDHKKV